MICLCAWCLKEGKSDADSLIGERPPLDDRRTTHGICDQHRKAVEERVAQLKKDAQRARDDAEDLERRVDP